MLVPGALFRDKVTKFLHFERNIPHKICITSDICNQKSPKTAFHLLISASKALSTSGSSTLRHARREEFVHSAAVIANNTETISIRLATDAHSVYSNSTFGVQQLPISAEQMTNKSELFQTVAEKERGFAKNVCNCSKWVLLISLRRSFVYRATVFFDLNEGAWRAT